MYMGPSSFSKMIEMPVVLSIYKLRLGEVIWNEQGVIAVDYLSMGHVSLQSTRERCEGFRRCSHSSMPFHNYLEQNSQRLTFYIG